MLELSIAIAFSALLFWDLGRKHFASTRDEDVEIVEQLAERHADRIGEELRTQAQRAKELNQTVHLHGSDLQQLQGSLRLELEARKEATDQLFESDANIKSFLKDLTAVVNGLKTTLETPNTEGIGGLLQFRAEQATWNAQQDAILRQIRQEMNGKLGDKFTAIDERFADVDKRIRDKVVNAKHERGYGK